MGNTHAFVLDECRPIQSPTRPPVLERMSPAQAQLAARPAPEDFSPVTSLLQQSHVQLSSVPPHKFFLGRFTLISDFDILAVGVLSEFPAWFWMLTSKIYFGVCYC